MITALAAALVLNSTAPQTIQLTPTDDISVYPHATDPEKDGYIRCWGSAGQAVAPDPDAVDDFSYSYLKFSLAKVPEKGTLKEAKLVIWHIADPGWNIDLAKQNPLQARGLRPDFSEKNWEYDICRSLYPDKANQSVFGSYAPEKIEAGKPVKFEIDLLKGPGRFARFFKEASDSPERELALAITSSIDPAEVGQKSVYKFYSKDWEKAEVKPTLTLVVE